LFIISHKSPNQQLENQPTIILLSLLMYQYVGETGGELGIRQLGLCFWFQAREMCCLGPGKHLENGETSHFVAC